MGENVGRAVEEAREMMTRVQAIVNELEVLVACLMALAEIAYLHVEDLTVFICRRTWFSLRRNWRVDDISGAEPHQYASSHSSFKSPIDFHNTYWGSLYRRGMIFYLPIPCY